jgi:hypothetical protein
MMLDWVQGKYAPDWSISFTIRGRRFRLRLPCFILQWPIRKPKQRRVYSVLFFDFRCTVREWPSVLAEARLRYWRFPVNLKGWEFRLWLRRPDYLLSYRSSDRREEAAAIKGERGVSAA